MAYTRRRSSYRRRRRSVFGKKAVAAIKRIAQQPVETKHFPFYQDLFTWLNDAGYVSGPSLVFLHNVYGQIPRENNTLTRTENSVVGNEFMSRGLRWELNAFTVASTPGASFDVQLRFTCFSYAEYLGSGTIGVAPNDDHLFDTQNDTTPTWSKWNTQAVKIHKQVIFRIDNNGNQNAMVRRKFYIPLRRKITSQLDQNLVANSFVREIKNNQVYWALEVFIPGFVGNIREYLFGNISTNIYFKDA
nr:MAG: capsid protein [Fringilla montifringilla CRESS-DNA-virus sp.]